MYLVMRKFLFLTLGLCVALMSMANQAEATALRGTGTRLTQTRGTASTSTAPRLSSSNDMLGTRIAIGECYAFDEETGVMDTVPINMGWKTALVAEEPEDIEYLTLQDLYGDYDFPIDLDVENRTAVMYYNYSSQYSTSVRKGHYQYDTVWTVTPIRWEVFMGEEQSYPDEKIGSILEDGSITFDGDFVFLTEVIASKTLVTNYQKVSQDTACFVSPVYRSLRLMVPNGIHKFNVQTRGMESLGTGVLSRLIQLSSANLLGSWFTGGSASTLGNGGIIGKPIDPRKPNQPSQPKLQSARQVHGSFQLEPGSITPAIGPREEPVYMYQADDSTVMVYNLFGGGITSNVLKVHDDGTVAFEPQMIGTDNQGFYYNGSSQDGQIELGNTGSVQSDSIVWNKTVPVYEDGEVALVVFDDNRLYFTDDNRFVYQKSVPPVITTEQTDDAVIITASADESVIVLMTADGTVVDNPYNVERGPVDQTVCVKASAQQYGKLPSDWVTLEVPVPARVYKPGDVNRDGRVSIKDVTELIDMLLSGEGD